MAAVAANYEKYFVPAIGEPVADDLLRTAALEPGERVLDVGCGTGVAARRAAQEVGDSGHVIGVDVSPAMIAVARTSTPSDLDIEWRQADAEAMPLPDRGFDAVLCQLSLQLMAHQLEALKEMRRVLAPGGRLVLNVPGDETPVFQALEDALRRHIGPEAGGFVHKVFSLHDPDEIQSLMRRADFEDVSVAVHTVPLHLPPPRDFLWQYVESTPLAGALVAAGRNARTALERDVIASWTPFEADGGLKCDQPIVSATARRSDRGE
jgi:ubiquinone/menaquinone biosynthesis C-methylase UbiE